MRCYTAKNLYEKRLIEGMTKCELARRSGLNRSTIHRIEQGSVKPLNSTYGGIAEAFDISPIRAKELCMAHRKEQK